MPESQYFIPPQSQYSSKECDDWDDSVEQLLHLSFSGLPWTFAGKRWGEQVYRFDCDSICVAVWPWFRITLIAIGIGAIEFIPVTALAWIVEAKLSLLEQVFDSNGIALMVATNLAFAVGLISIASGMVVYISHTAGGSGIPGIISYLNSGYIPHKELLSMKTLIVKAVSIVLAIGGGMIVGREGPAIHIGAATADILFRFIDRCAPSSLKLVKHTSEGEVFDGESAHEIAIVGASAGFATAFGAPIGGMLYVWEEMSTHWDNIRHVSIGARCFLGVALSTLVLKLLVSLVSENYNLKFHSIVTYHGHDESIYGQATWEYSDLPVILVLATVLGVFSGSFTVAAKWMHYFNKKTSFLRSNEAKVLYCVAVASLTAVVFSTLPLALSTCRKKSADTGSSHISTTSMWGNEGDRRLQDVNATSSLKYTRTYVQYNCEDGYYNELASMTLVGQEGILRHLMARDDQKFQSMDLLVVFLLYSAMSLLAFGASIPSGSFVPMLTIGALAGRMVGEGWSEVTSTSGSAIHSKPGVYAVIGAAGMLGGWTRTMMAIVVTMTEITGDVSLMIPMIISILISREVASWISHNSFTHSLVDNLEDLDYSKSPDHWFNSRDRKNRISRDFTTSILKSSEGRKVPKKGGGGNIAFIVDNEPSSPTKSTPSNVSRKQSSYYDSSGVEMKLQDPQTRSHSLNHRSSGILKYPIQRQRYTNSSSKSDSESVDLKYRARSKGVDSTQEEKDTNDGDDAEEKEETPDGGDIESHQWSVRYNGRGHGTTYSSISTSSTSEFCYQPELKSPRLDNDDNGHAIRSTRRQLLKHRSGAIEDDNELSPIVSPRRPHRPGALSVGQHRRTRSLKGKGFEHIQRSSSTFPVVGNREDDDIEYDDLRSHRSVRDIEDNIT